MDISRDVYLTLSWLTEGDLRFKQGMSVSFFLFFFLSFFFSLSLSLSLSCALAEVRYNMALGVKAAKTTETVTTQYTLARRPLP